MAGEGLLLLFALLFFALAIILPFWVYSDAQKNSPHSPVLWALVVFFGGLLGLLLYFIIGRTGRGGRPTRAQY
ncbi:PLDc N-terminal domain-containing protein [Haladaptatus salinisoli]|uniref:PLDc N-terminal domain-containing protein n=1 Tax=Haladaptatus salinisoli TaxID=2884876 RepID=UPI001D0B678B|nr:PLDc N-terminal domain-containing protein [Haladaptatus salinisoli]